MLIKDELAYLPKDALDLWKHLQENHVELLKFICAAHEIAYEDMYRDQGNVGTSEYLAKAVPELQKFFETSPRIFREN